MPRSSPKRMMSIDEPTAARNRLEVGQMDFHQPVEEAMGLLRFAGQEHEEIVGPIEELAGLEEVAAEQADDGPVRALAESPGPLAERLRVDRTGRGRNPGPHAFAEGVVQHARGRPDSASGKYVCSKYSVPSGMWAKTLPELDRMTHRSDRRSMRVQAGMRQSVPSGRVQGFHASSARAKPRPISTQSTPKRLEHVFIDNRKLLNHVVDADGSRLRDPGTCAAWGTPSRRCPRSGVRTESTGTRSGSIWFNAARTLSLGVMKSIIVRPATIYNFLFAIYYLAVARHGSRRAVSANGKR